MEENDHRSPSAKERAMACLQAGRFADAHGLLKEACAGDADDSEAWFLLGAVNGQLGRYEDAVACCRKVVALNPQHVDALYNLGQAHMHLNRLAEAAEAYRAVVRLQPGHADAHNHLGIALQEQGDLPGAAHAYREALRLRPDLEGTRFLLAAVGGAPTPNRAPGGYVRKLFDRYADRFEDQLLGPLRYRTPALLDRVIRGCLQPGAGGLDIVDLGCGTGLCGPLLRDLARTLTGVDLSPAMLEKAQSKGVYDSLHVGDIGAFLQNATAAYDLIVAADVFPYVGDLQEAFERSRGALRPGGVLAFSVEAADTDAPFVLRPTDRYAHARTYLRELAPRYGFAERRFDEVTLRRDRGAPVRGYLVVLGA